MYVRIFVYTYLYMCAHVHVCLCICVCLSVFTYAVCVYGFCACALCVCLWVCVRGYNTVNTNSDIYILMANLYLSTLNFTITYYISCNMYLNVTGFAKRVLCTIINIEKSCFKC